MPQQRRSQKSRSRPFSGEPELIVIADSAAGVRATPEGATAVAVDPKPITKALKDARMAPLFGASEERVQFRVRAAAAAIDGELPDLSTYYRVHADAPKLDALAQELAAADGVVAAYVKPPAEPAIFEEGLNEMVPSGDPAPPTTADFTARQGYLDAAPGGVDARFAWTRAGGKGTNVRIADVEGAWRFDHEDLLLNTGGAVGTESTDLGWRNHGTAVQGECSGDENTFGITGICPDANFRGFSIFGGTGSAGAITAAANALSAGDVLLIELHRPGPGASGVGQDGFIAMEWWPDDFAAITFATATRGVVVVEAAGNGARNLDDPIYNTPQTGFPPSWRNPFNRALADSGAIVVGAGAPPPGTHGRDHGPDRSRLDFSNYGSCVDTQGWGREVTSTGYGDLQGGVDERVWYTDQFSGTSSASPIVVGVVGCVQGNRRARGLAPYTPGEMRTRLRTTGSPQQDAPGRPSSEHIGNRPNLRQLMAIKSPLIEKGRLKKEKLEKVEKLEKPERKEKIEKLEKEKVEKFHKPEKLEKIEKLEKEKVEKIDKPEKLEKEKFEVENKRLGLENKIQERIGEIREGFGPTAAEGGPGYEERLAALEAAVEHLTHFIGPELRPDLSMGALTEEPDYESWGEEPQKLTEG